MVLILGTPKRKRERAVASEKRGRAKGSEISPVSERHYITSESKRAKYRNAHEQEVTACHSPCRLTDVEKLLSLVSWNNHADVYPNVAMLSRVYLTPRASSVTVEGLYSVTGIFKNARGQERI